MIRFTFYSLQNVGLKNVSHYIWVISETRLPQNRWFIMENPFKTDDLGVFGGTHFEKLPYSYYIFLLYVLNLYLMGVPRVASLSCTAVAATWAWQSGPVKRWDGMVQWVEHNRPSLGLIITSTYVSCIICIHIIIYVHIYYNI